MRWKNKRKKVFILISFLVLGVSLGYALLSSNTTINGNSMLANSTWDIHFENVVPSTNMSLTQEDSVATINPQDTTKVTYSVSFDTPGQYYEFTVDAVNDGTIDAMIDTISSNYQIDDGEVLDITSTNLPAYLSYTSTYVDDSPITLGDLLNAGDSVTYKIRVEFLKDISSDDLPTTEQNITITFGVNYVQAKNNNINYHTITFDKNSDDAIGEMEEQSILERTYTSLNSNSYSLTNYGFIGWNTKADGTGISYLDESKIFVTDDITLYAQWGRLYTLTFNKNNNNAVGNEYSYELVLGIPTVIPDIAFSAYRLSGKVIDSYNTQANNEGISYYQGQTIIITSDTTLYAHWDDSLLTPNIYWALQDNDDDDINEKLVFSSNPVSGNYQGSIEGDAEFTANNHTPWTNSTYSYSSDNLSKDVSDVEVMDEIVPASTAYWFYGVGYDAESFYADLSNLNTYQTTSMRNMFQDAGYSAENWDIGDLSNWNTSKVEDMSYMFATAGYYATDFYLYGLSNWNTSKVKNMSYMFYEAGYEQTYYWDIDDISDWNVSKVENMSSMFEEAGYNAESWYAGDFSNWKTLNAIDMNRMFLYAGYKAEEFEIDLSNWNTSKVEDMSGMFSATGYNATTWSIGDLSNWNTSNVKWMIDMFKSSGNKVSDWSIGDISNWNTSKVRTMHSMFAVAGYSAEEFILDLSGWDTSNVTDMEGMFYNAGCNAEIFELDLSGWNTSNVTNFQISSDSFAEPMFQSAGYRATTWNVIIPPTNGGGINNTTSIMYGKTSSVLTSAPRGVNNIQREFTLATP